MNNLSSFVLWLVDAKIRASDKDLPVQQIQVNQVKFCSQKVTKKMEKIKEIRLKTLCSHLNVKHVMQAFPRKAN